MRELKYIFTMAAIILSLSTFAFSQDKDKGDALADNATLAESQAWLTKALNKNFGYRLIADSVKISDIKFDGTRMSYRVYQTYTDQKSALGDRPGLGNTGATVAKDISYDVYEDVSFDLKDINISQMKREVMTEPKGMQLITLETIGKKDAITFNRKGTSVRYNSSGARAMTSFPIKEKAGEQIAKAMIHTIKLCQTANAAK